MVNVQNPSQPGSESRLIQSHHRFRQAESRQMCISF
jgi:hypothetical protein